MSPRAIAGHSCEAGEGPERHQDGLSYDNQPGAVSLVLTKKVEDDSG